MYYYICKIKYLCSRKTQFMSYAKDMLCQSEMLAVVE
jgi:hypothetical protein